MASQNQRCESSWRIELCRRSQEQLESEALPESFCIIESRDSVKVSWRCGTLGRALSQRKFAGCASCRCPYTWCA